MPTWIDFTTDSIRTLLEQLECHYKYSIDEKKRPRFKTTFPTHSRHPLIQMEAPNKWRYRSGEVIIKVMQSDQIIVKYRDYGQSYKTVTISLFHPKSFDILAKLVTSGIYDEVT